VKFSFIRRKLHSFFTHMLNLNNGQILFSHNPL